jgi:hypothetical protein
MINGAPFLLALGVAAIIEAVMVWLGSPQHVWFWCSLLRVCG